MRFVLGEERGDVLKVFMLICLAICWSGPAVGGILWLFWCLVLEIVECRWDIVGHIHINCPVYVVPLQGEYQMFSPVQYVVTRYNNFKAFMRCSASFLFEYYTPESSNTRVKTI